MNTCETSHVINSISSPSILKVHGRQSLNNVPFRKVRFNLLDHRVVNIKQMLINYDQNNDKDKTLFNNFICDIRDSAIDIIVSTVKKCKKYSCLFKNTIYKI